MISVYVCRQGKRRNDECMEKMGLVFPFHFKYMQRHENEIHLF